MRRLHLTRPRLSITGVTLAALALPLFAVVGSGSAMAATTYTLSPVPTVAAAFLPDTTITTGGTTALSITITNPSTATVNGLAFTDTLPAGVVVDNPNGTSGTCGSAGVLTATPGSNVISLTGGSLAKGANCVVSAAVTSTTVGTYTDSTGNVTYTGGTAGSVTYTGGSSASGATATLTVVGLPTISITSPKANQTFTLGQKVKATFTCADAAGGPGLVGCTSDAPNPSFVDTATAGPGEITVTAVSADGGVTTQTVDYTVLPSNKVTASPIKAAKSGALKFQLKLPGKGKLVVQAKLTGSHTAFPLATLNKTIGGAGSIAIKLSPTAAAIKALKAAEKSKKIGTLTIHVTVTFTPTGGRAAHLKLPAPTLP